MREGKGIYGGRERQRMEDMEIERPCGVFYRADLLCVVVKKVIYVSYKKKTQTTKIKV